MTRREMLVHRFPRLRESVFEITSRPTPTYNCIAWAADDEERKWWPNSVSGYYWPPDAPKEATISGFVQAFQTLGYEVCDLGATRHEPGVEKVAVYALGESPTHAARQLASGVWSSKLGNEVDIEHTLDGLRGNEHGVVVQILRRPRSRQEPGDCKADAP